MAELLTVDEDIRSQAVERIKRKRDLARNLVIFALANAGLWAIWAVDGADVDNVWPAIVTGVWAVLLVIDAFKVFERPITDEQVQDEVARLRRG